ncbi:hypothetical protein chiPu_0032411, partial [Chiloscyllium punctatum]|nr:hypothetical protein [Chiloscyllium punctatum]
HPADQPERRGARAERQADRPDGQCRPQRARDHVEGVGEVRFLALSFRGSRSESPESIYPLTVRPNGFRARAE